MIDEEDFIMTPKAENPVNTILGAISYYGGDYKSLMRGMRVFLNALDRNAMIAAYNKAFGKSTRDFEGVGESADKPKNLVESIINGEEIPDVEIAEKVSTFWKCPHCKDEIYEKHSYIDNIDQIKEGGSKSPIVYIHSDCGGKFIPPPLSQEHKDWLDDFLK